MSATPEQVDAWWKQRAGAGPHEFESWYWGDGSDADRQQWAWCDASASKCLHDTGSATVAPSARCDVAVQAYQKAGLWTPWRPDLTPKPGWQAFYMWDPSRPENGSLAQHTGVVLEGFVGGHYAGEGNVGNRVVYRVRRASNIVGYGRTAMARPPKRTGKPAPKPGVVWAYWAGHGWKDVHRIPEDAQGVEGFVNHRDGHGWRRVQ